jgi:uncharacterized protein (DUF305 family)
MTRTCRTVGTDRNWSRRCSSLVGVLLLVAVASVACTQEPEKPAGPPNSAPVIVPGKPGEKASTIPPGEAKPIEQEPPNEADVTFIQNMIVHHAQAVEMAELAPDRASAKNVKGIADRIGDSQKPEIDMMNRWLEQHEKPTVDPEAPAHGGHGAHSDTMSMPGFATSAQLDALRAARGARFDTLFLQMMVAHHEGALVMAEQVRTTGVDVRVQEIADDITVTQIDEIHRMRGML